MGPFRSPQLRRSRRIAALACLVAGLPMLLAASSHSRLLGLYPQDRLPIHLLQDILPVMLAVSLTLWLFVGSRDRELQLHELLRNLPAGVARLDRNLRVRYLNPALARSLNLACESALGRPVEELLPVELAHQLLPHCRAALAGQRHELTVEYRTDQGDPGSAQVIVVADGTADGVLVIFSDTTEREQGRLRLEQTQREIGKLHRTLDAHAIVAFTDARGIITRVNEKSCSVSQYTPNELIGRSFRLLNSGHHPPEFFRELWRTISRGEVWNGEICNRAKDGTLYWLHTTIVPCIGQDGLPEEYIAIRADITKRKQAEEEARRMALHDVLTGLPNRRLLGERLAQAIGRAAEKGSYGAVLLIDLDHFKEINDTQGYGQGDELLRLAAGRLIGAVRQGDLVARVGGDSFMAILEDIGAERDSSLAHVGDSAERIRGSLAKPFRLQFQEVHVASSIGVVLFHQPDDLPDELIKQAEIALSQAKSAGRDQLCFFDPSLQAEVASRTRMLRELRQARDRGELRLFYQPVVDARRRILGVEALIRWQHAEHGLVSPAFFVPLAEQSGLIPSIGEWVLETACLQLARWAEDPLRRDWSIAVNVSARQLDQSDFVAGVERALWQSGARADRLRLELTESVLHDNLQTTIDKMERLRRLGVRFSLDDFGTGYSSLGYLKRLPLDQLKIDKSFVDDVLTNPSDAAIARTILALAEILGVGVVAEGVETGEQMAFLLENGCAAFQGYLFSRPVPVEELPDSLGAGD